MLENDGGTSMNWQTVVHWGEVGRGWYQCGSELRSSATPLTLRIGLQKAASAPRRGGGNITPPLTEKRCQQPNQKNECRKMKPRDYSAQIFPCHSLFTPRIKLAELSHQLPTVTAFFHYYKKNFQEPLKCTAKYSWWDLDPRNRTTDLKNMYELVCEKLPLTGTLGHLYTSLGT